MNTSTQRLVDALVAADDPRNLNAIIYRARQEHYHDFASPLATPELQLVADLCAVGHEQLSQRVINGEFDATREESAAWASSPDGQATIRELGEPAARALGFPWPGDAAGAGR